MYYEPGTPSRKLVTEIMDTFLLVNVVHNDFKQPDAIFEPFFKAGVEFAATQGTKQETHHLTNGLPNGKANGHAY